VGMTISTFISASGFRGSTRPTTGRVTTLIPKRGRRSCGAFPRAELAASAERSPAVRCGNGP
jgi:hypothetical protein